MSENNKENNVVTINNEEVDAEEKSYQLELADKARFVLDKTKERKPLTIIVIGQDVDGKPIFDTNVQELPAVIWYLEKVKKDLL